MDEEPVVDQRTADLGSARLGPLMVKLSLPGMVGMLVMSIYNIIDTFWVSGLPNGTQAIAALTVLFPVQMIAGAIGMGMGAGVTSLVSRRFGESRIEEANRVAGTAISVAFGLGAVLTAVCILWAKPMVRLFGATPDVLDLSVSYLVIVAFGYPSIMAATALNGLYRGAGNSLTPMLTTALSVAINAVLAPFTIYGLGPFPRLEVRGAAWATVIAQIAGALAAFLYLRSGRSGFRVRRAHLRPDWSIIVGITQVGGPASVTNAVRAAVASSYNWVLGGYGAAAIAAHGLSNRIMMLVISCLGGGVMQALVPIVGYTFGARDYRRMWSAYRLAALWTSGGALILGGLVCLFAPQILRPLAHEPELLRLGVISLRLKMCTFFLVEPQMMAVFSLQGMGFGGRAMWVTLARDVIFLVPGLFLLSAWFGVIGAYAAQTVADVLTLFVAGAVLWQVYRAYPPSAGAAVPEAQAEAAGG